ncbi:hypothetical protein LTR37_001589 [Vermiconidia calcicola]|uniref:Uncharacterized protein n=1 Tax=Vermiconidia calcicola TaxID=1690605 RepID=A0ACC3NVK8_9PEZI|nr:hypothetical protein LTR37_001589 [Vermiconidia calcicola]
MVSRYVCDIITQSTRLQQQLCLTPVGPATSHPDEWNPFLFYEQSIIVGTELSDYTIRLPIPQLYRNRNNAVKPSCLQMSISQPPATSAHISWSYILPGSPPRKEARGKTLRIESGITIDDVIETCWKHVDERSKLVLERSQIWV